MSPSVHSSRSKGGSDSPAGSESGQDGSSLKTYKLSVIPREEFEQFHTFVQAVFDEGRQRFSNQLITVSTDIDDFPTVHQGYLAKSDSLGVAMADWGKNNEEFHLWMTPSYKFPSFKFYMTLAHELTHGYAGLQYGHSAHWRRWFYRVLFHLVQAKMMPKPASGLELVFYSVESAYNHSSNDLHSLPIEALAKASSEHDKVLSNYWSRLHA